MNGCWKFEPSVTSQNWALVEEVESCEVKMQGRENAPKIRESARVEREKSQGVDRLWPLNRWYPKTHGDDTVILVTLSRVRCTETGICREGGSRSNVGRGAAPTSN